MVITCCQYKLIAMPVKVWKVLFVYPAQLHALGQSKFLHFYGRQSWTDHQLALIIKADQKTVEQGIEIGHQQKTIEYIQSLRVAGAFRPRLGMTGAQYLGQRDSSDSAGASPVFHECFAIDVLANSFPTDALDLRFCGKRG